uniref:EGF-like domain-containing protein n=1 Tax=Panagrolaimus sp. PS1159 TaxID=55785 RepID=A0AC35FVW4_9BILA
MRYSYACSPQEIQTSLRISLKTSPLEYDEIEDLLSQETIEEEVQNSTDFITSSTYGDFGDPVFIATSCPPESANSYCRNGWNGLQCQHTYNPKLYESAIVAPEVENVNVGSLITVILVGLIIFSGLIYLSKTFCKAHDLRDYMYSESTVDPTTMNPVQMYPFSRRSSSSPSTSDHLRPISSYTVCRQQQIRQEAEKEYQQELSQITLKSYNHFPYP